MKTSLKLWACALTLALFTNFGQSAEPTPAVKAAAENWWTDFSVSPYGTVQHRDFEGKGIIGAGLELRYQINRTVSIGARNSLFDSPEDKCSEGGWLSGAGVDETEAIFRADLIKGGGAGKDRFGVFLLGSGGYNWNTKDFDLGVGPGVFLRFHRNVSLEADYRVRATFGGPEFGALTTALSIKF